MLVLLIGPSGCGKSSVASKLEYPRLISTTTRPPRKGEIDGVDYIFVSRDEFNKLNFVESVEYDKELYGYQSKHIAQCYDPDKVFVGVVNAEGVRSLRHILGEKNVFAISIEAKACKLAKWMKKRGDTDSMIINRLINLHDTKELVKNSIIADIVIEESDLARLTRKIDELIKERIQEG